LLDDLKEDLDKEVEEKNIKAVKYSTIKVCFRKWNSLI